MHTSVIAHTRRPPAPVLTIYVGLALFTLLSVVSFWRPGIMSTDALSVVTCLLASTCCLATAWYGRGSMRIAWSLFALFVAMYAGGDVLWLLYPDDGGVPLLGSADALYVGGLVPAAIGLMAYPVLRDIKGLWVQLVLDIAVLSTSVLFITHTLVLDRVISGSDTLMEKVMLAIYPVTDVLLVCLVLTLLLRSIGQLRVDIALVGATFVVYTFADNGYAVMVLRGEDTLGTWVDLAYTVAPLLLATGAVLAAMTPAPRRTLKRHLTGMVVPMLPDLTATAAVTLAVAGGTHGPFSAGLAVATLLAVATRQFALTTIGQQLREQLERRVAERTAELEELTEHYTRLDAMKFEFVTAVSHELRTPLTAIRGSLEMLHDGDAGELPPTAQKVVAIAARGGERLSRLVNDIIDLERLESGVFAFVPAQHSVHSLVAEATQSLLPLAQEQEVDILIEAAEGEAWCDADRIQQVLVNLLGNALKFSPSGTTVRVEARQHDGEVLVSVRDQGRGIPASQLDAIFDRFHQVEDDDSRQKGGAGLGLTICRRIIESHQGRIWVESPGTGTTFWFSLPSRAPEVAPLPGLAGHPVLAIGA